MVPVDRRGFEPQVPPVHGHVPEHGGPAEGDDGQDDSAPPPGEANGKEEIGGGGGVRRYLVKQFFGSIFIESGSGQNPDPSCFLTLPGIYMKLIYNYKILPSKEVN